MTSLEINNFKAHKQLTVPFNNKNFLLYGDNGAGKSSIYESLKVLFFKDEIESKIDFTSFADEEQVEIKREFWAAYNHSSLNVDFDLNLLNGTEPINKEDYQVFMLDINNLFFDKFLKLTDLLQNVYFKIDRNYLASYNQIETRTNQLLEQFLADITITIDREDGYHIKITDIGRNLTNKKDIKNYFNEAKLNLVVLSLFFSVIEITKDTNKKQILILDDFITSLDMSNRTLLIQYILNISENSQLIILTHNVYFYNLIMYLLNDVYLKKEKWQYANLYEVNNESSLSISWNEIVLDDLDSMITGHLNQNDIDSIGTKIRKKFEILLYELSKHMMIGAVEESNTIIQCIEKNHMVHNTKKSMELLCFIDDLVNEDNPHNLQHRIKIEINKHRIDDLTSIQKIIQELKIYRKVSMHSLSHGRIGQHNFSLNEIKQSLKLLRLLEPKVKSLNTSSQRRTDGM